jgi:acyl carrier protein
MPEPTTATEMCSPPHRDMAEDLIRFINDVLPEIHAGQKQRLQVDRDTCLFESGLIDSMGILHLMAFIERKTGRKIPPRMVVMKHFRSVEAICQAFDRSPGESCDNDDN